jgi:hypothetical protein
MRGQIFNVDNWHSSKGGKTRSMRGQIFNVDNWHSMRGQIFNVDNWHSMRGQIFNVDNWHSSKGGKICGVKSLMLTTGTLVKGARPEDGWGLPVLPGCCRVVAGSDPTN